MITTSSLLVAMIIERAISIGRPEVVWDIWRRACRNITYLLWATTLVFSVSGLLCVDLGTLTSDDTDSYPVCMPWWDNEMGTDVAWYKIVALSFSTLPCIAVLFSILLLTIRERRFKSAMRSGVSALNHFNAMFVEIKATLHFKFVRSFMWLGFLFVLTTSPIGLFIVLGPDLQITFDQLYPESDQGNSTSFQQLPNKGRPVFVGVPSTPGPRGMLRYSSISRSDVETCLWLVYYTYSLCVTPVFLKTEVLFWREWCGRVRTVTNFICCRKTLLPKWRTMSGLNEEMKQGHLVGPYIPSSNDLEVPFGIQRALDEARLTRMQTTAGANDMKETYPAHPNHQPDSSAVGGGHGGESSRTNHNLSQKKANECGERTRPGRKQLSQKSEDTSSM
ncbi:hypothetical protein Btru_007979 [Bulinus truncatus]|nr:hypothetical protein Btru_007979 [Bulinus truncatus]